MAYAPANRPMYDADSHIMELPDFLQKYADSELRADIPAVSYSASLVTDEEVGVIMARGGRHSEEHVAEMIAMGDSLIERVKEIQALGAFDGSERSKAMDILGFKKQLVFATHSVMMPFSPSSKIPPKLRYGAARAHNRHMADFCAHDSRLMGVAVVPLDEPAFALEELEFALKSGAKAIWIAHRPAGGRSPGHVELDPFWARLQESDTPFVMHVGGSPLQLDRAWANNGRPPTKDWMGAGDARAAGLGGEDLGQDRRQPRALHAQAVGATDAADGVHAVCVRGGWRFDRSIQPRPVPLLDRLSAHRRRPQSDRALRDLARRSFRLDSRSILLGEFSAHLSRSAGVIAPARQSYSEVRRRTRKSPPPLLLQSTSDSISIRLAHGSDASG